MAEDEKHILCVGMCVLDIIHVCAEYPKEDTDKRCQSGYWQRGGNASNNCTVLRKLGVPCEFLGMISNSPAFGFLYDDCRQRQIIIKNCPNIDMDPPFSSIILAQSKGTRTIVHSNPGFPILTFEHFKKIDLSSYAWIHFEGRSVEETVQMIDMIRLFNKNHKKSIRISLEMEKLNKELFRLACRADLVFISRDMAEHMGWSSAQEAIYKTRQIIKDIQSKENGENNLPWPTPCLISPWGSECSDCLSSSDEYASLPACDVNEVVDSLGAGDTFVAACIYALNYLKKSLAESVKYANKVAAFKIQHRGYDDLEQME
ncbi:ketohexokinase [Stomoxys calcitrans]|uniref:Carbohydrate kinase PfkB domain-containing protein n=1 Tax=Stomoxys calcitrans TaxID=35570 RepID=A0A1I8Q2V5_STOCA|nr:ketohexokinase [Stomoxys calcitrans]XP_013115489.1 ketohexokinase [Stomoxys calcitrans]XP_013115490.1 ketohexokinase [Stomoxys calcitrans]